MRSVFSGGEGKSSGMSVERRRTLSLGVKSSRLEKRGWMSFLGVFVLGKQRGELSGQKNKRGESKPLRSGGKALKVCSLPHCGGHELEM